MSQVSDSGYVKQHEFELNTQMINNDLTHLSGEILGNENVHAVQQTEFIDTCNDDVYIDFELDNFQEIQILSNDLGHVIDHCQ